MDVWWVLMTIVCSGHVNATCANEVAYFPSRASCISAMAVVPADDGDWFRGPQPTRTVRNQVCFGSIGRPFWNADPTKGEAE